MIPSKLIAAEHLKEMLVAGETYSLVYLETIAGGDHIEELYDVQNTFLDRSVSVAAWEKSVRNVRWRCIPQWDLR